MRLRALRAPREDVGTNHIRLDGPTRRHLHLALDDIVELRAFRGVGWARVQPAPRDEREIGLARIDESRLRAMGGRMGGWIFVRDAEPRPADRLTLSTHEPERLLEGDVLRSLEGYTVLDADVLHLELPRPERSSEANLAVAGLRLATVEMKRGRLDIVPVRVLDTVPAGPVTVRRGTELSLTAPDEF